MNVFNESTVHLSNLVILYAKFQGEDESGSSKKYTNPAGDDGKQSHSFVYQPVVKVYYSFGS